MIFFNISHDERNPLKVQIDLRDFYFNIILYQEKNLLYEKSKIKKKLPKKYWNQSLHDDTKV